MGKRRLIAETGAGQHGVASATAAALFGLECTVFMGEVDTQRQELNVFRMELLGATVRTVTSGSRTLKDAVNEAMREWVTCVEDTHYCLGSVMGPHPSPWMVREFQRVMGEEARRQLPDLGVGTPDLVVACVGGGSNATASSPDSWTPTPASSVWRPRAGPRSARARRASCTGCAPSCCRTRRVRSSRRTRSPRGSTTPGSVRSTRYLDSIGRARYLTAHDDEVLVALQRLARTEGIIAALESAHAVAWVLREAGRDIPSGSSVLIGLSGRGDKDMSHVRALLSRPS